MTLPRVLVIDDQYARDEAERALFVRRSGLVLADSDTSAVTELEDRRPVAEVTICSGQRVSADSLENDYEVIRRRVKGAEESWALVLLDVRFDSGKLGPGGIPVGQAGDDTFGEEVRDRLARDFPELPVVMLSSKRQRDLANQAVPYLSKHELTDRELRIALLRHGRLSPAQGRDILGLKEGVISGSDRSFAAFRTAFIHAASPASVLILGESGTGKEVLARYVHDSSARRDKRFVAVNCAAVSRDLVESELFGHEKGAFTGANMLRRGRFEFADGGTIFLDEIGDMAPETQTKILRVLQEHSFERVGGTKAIHVDVRIVAATHRNLEDEVAAGRFREDLYYRLRGIPIFLPALRDRPEDTRPLAEWFVSKAMKATGREGIVFSESALQRLGQYSFPGNVRELENLVTRLVSAAGHHEVLGEDAVRAALEERAIARTELSLGDVFGLLAGLPIGIGDEALAAAKPRLAAAYRTLLQKLAGAALERCRDPVTGRLNRQRAMRLLEGNPALSGTDSRRLINEIRGRTGNTEVTEDDLEDLVSLWSGADHAGSRK